MSQHYENGVFLTAVQYWLRTGLLPVKAQNPNWSFSIQWGPTTAAFTHGYSFPVNPGSDWVNTVWPKLVSQIRLFRPNFKVRVEGGAHIQIDAGKFFPLALPAYSQPQPPPQIPGPYDPLPSPYPNPIYCIPCEDKIFTA